MTEETVTNARHGHVLGRNGMAKIFANRTQAQAAAFRVGGEVVWSLGNRFMVRVTP